MYSTPLKICPSTVNSSVLHDGDFGRCFQQVVLITPIYTVLTFVSLYFCLKARSQSPVVFNPYVKEWLVVLRWTAHLGIVVSQIGLILKQTLASYGSETSLASFISESVILLSWCMSLIVTVLWRRQWHYYFVSKMLKSLIGVWLLSLLSCSFELYSSILYAMGNPSALDEEPFGREVATTIYIRWFMYVSIIAMEIPFGHQQSVSDSINAGQEPDSSNIEFNTGNPVSEHSFSHASRATFHWVHRLFEHAKQSQFPSIHALPFVLPPSMNPISNHCKLKLKQGEVSTFCKLCPHRSPFL